MAKNFNYLQLMALWLNNIVVTSDGRFQDSFTRKYVSRAKALSIARGR